MTARWILAADLGQAHDYTAIGILERTAPAAPGTAPILKLRHIERLKLGTPYPTQVARIATLATGPKVAGSIAVAVDATGVGAAVVDMLRPALRPVPLYEVTITGGDRAHKDFRRWRIPKRDLIAAAQVDQQNRTLTVDANLAEAKTLVSELQAYHVSVSVNGHDSYGNDWREAPNDDLVLMLCIGSYVARATDTMSARILTPRLRTAGLVRLHRPF